MASRRIPAKRFQPAAGTVHDRLTGLTWCRDASAAVFPLDWQAAREFVDQMNREDAFGLGRWRLPTRRELFSLISHDAINPALPKEHPFENVFPGYYWTGTPSRRLPDQAWYIHLGGGRVYRGMKHASYMVWPVTGDAEDPDAAKGAGRWETRREEVLDRRTGLTWERPTHAGRRPVSWREALDAVNAMNAGDADGRSEWRLPNIRELESLIDVWSHSPAFPPEHPFDGVADGYWSSTTSVYEPSYAWVLYTRDGAIGVGFKAKPEFGVWAVRRTNR
jgi:hypothetical protein